MTSGILCEVFSRKHTLLWGAMWMILGSYLAAGAVVNQPAYLFAGRFFTGIGVGTLSAIGYVEWYCELLLLILTMSIVPCITPSWHRLKCVAFLSPCSS